MKKLILEYIDEVGKWLITKNISSLNCGWTDDNSVYYKLEMNDYTVYIEIFFMNKDRDDLKDGVETVLNIFKDKENTFAYGGTLKDCLEHISSQVKI